MAFGGSTKYKFNCGITSLSRERQSTSTTDKDIETVKKTILDSRRVTLKEVTDEVGTSFGSCQTIFENVLGVICAIAKIFSTLINFEQKQRGINIAQELFNDVMGIWQNRALLSKLCFVSK